MKKVIQKVINKFGFQIQRISSTPSAPDDLMLYEQLFSNEDILRKHFYNIGSGSFRHPVWTNVDYSSEWEIYKENHIDINFDLFSKKSLPIQDNSANIVYSSQTIEHIDDQSAQNLFNESYRILKKKGIIRIVAPDINLFFRACITNDRHFYFWIKDYSNPEFMKVVGLKKKMTEVSLKQVFLYEFASQTSEVHIDADTQKISDQEFDTIFTEMKYEDALDYCTSKCSIELQKKYPGNHINWWNKDKIFKMLKVSGFNDIYLSGYGQSISPVLRNTFFFDNTFPTTSIFVEAIKN
jgi:predicted SAM-dependent methyltransferase